MEVDKRTEGIFAAVLQHRTAIMSVIVAMTNDFDVSEDLFQNAALEIVRSFTRFDTEADAVRWMKGVARNIVLRHWTSAAKGPVLMDREALEVIGGVMVEDPGDDDAENRKQALRECLRTLSRRNRNLVTLRYAGNVKGPRLAEKAGVNPASIRTMLLRIRESLRECIKNRLEVTAQ